MVNSASKLEVVIDLFNAGLLCKCCQTEKVWEEDDIGGYWQEEIIHNTTCDGRVKMMVMLNEDANG